MELQAALKSHWFWDPGIENFTGKHGSRYRELYRKTSAAPARGESFLSPGRGGFFSLLPRLSIHSGGGRGNYRFIGNGDQIALVASFSHARISPSK